MHATWAWTRQCAMAARRAESENQNKRLRQRQRLSSNVPSADAKPRDMASGEVTVVDARL